MTSATGSAMAAIFARSTCRRVAGAVATKSGASSPQSAIQASEAESWPAMTTKVGAKATPGCAVTPPLRQRMKAIGSV